MRGKQNSKALLEDPDISRWYNNVARGATVTADVYLRRFRNFCEEMNTTPKQLVQMDENALADLLMDFITAEEKKFKAGSYIHSTVKAVRSWLAHNNIVIRRKIKVKNAWKSATLNEERVPTQDELRKIFLSATSRDRITCVLMAHSGLRPEVLGNYLGDDGLVVGDFPEMRIVGNEVIFDKVPTMVKVRSELSKAGHIYFSFLSEEGTEYLRSYLEERIRNGENVTADTDIITPVWASKRFLRSINIGDSARKAIRSAGFKWRPYVLRSYFASQLLLAESKGAMTSLFREYFMGHTSGVEGVYTTRKGILTTEMIESMREAYRKSQVFLMTVHVEDEEKKLAEFRKQILRMSGISQEEIEGMDLESMADQDIMDQLKKKLMKAMGENGHRQKVISMGQVEEFIDRGWEYVSPLGEERAIVKLPFT